MAKSTLTPLALAMALVAREQRQLGPWAPAPMLFTAEQHPPEGKAPVCAAGRHGCMVAMLQAAFTSATIAIARTNPRQTEAATPMLLDLAIVQAHTKYSIHENRQRRRVSCRSQH